jgi:hypothetical protein
MREAARWRPVSSSSAQGQRRAAWWRSAEFKLSSRAAVHEGSSMAAAPEFELESGAAAWW